MGLGRFSSTSIIYQRVWKASILLVLASFLLYILWRYQGNFPASVVPKAVGYGFLQALLVLSFGRLLLWQLPDKLTWIWVRVLFAPYPTASLGFLLSCIGSFLVFVGFLPASFKSVDLLSPIALSFIAGTTLPVIGFGCFPFRLEDSNIVYRISSERYDAFLGTLVASSLLGSALIGASHITNQDDWGGILVPLYFSLATLLLTFLGALLTEFKKPHSNAWFLGVSVFAAIALIAIASTITSYALPGLLFINGKEITSYQIFFAMQIGILAGWVAGNIVKLYYFLAKATVRFLLHNSIKNIFIGVAIRFLLNASLGLTPALVAFAAIGLSYAVADIYGASLAILGIVSNVGVSLAIGNNPLSKRHLDNLTFAQRRKLELLLPSYSTFGKVMLQRLRTIV